MTPQLGVYFSTAETLLTCICDALNDSEFHCPSRACISPGIEPSYEDCCAYGGQLTINLVRWFEAATFPGLSVAGGGPIGPSSVAKNCVVPYTVVEYQISLVRCTPVGNGQNPPTCDELQESARMAISDAETVRHAVRCCVADFPREYQWLMGDTLSVGPEGGCAGSNMSLWVGFNNCRPC